ncbi:MAG: DUF3465 domain-containing protein [Candidatus Baltobacteraceae bacterium]
MKRLALLALLAGCAQMPSATALDQVQRMCASGAAHAEVTLSGNVTRVLGTRMSAGGAHEGFVFSTASCSPYRRPCAAANLRVEDNVDLTGPVPLHAGETVTVRGQYECDDGVIHWTHRDPRGRHTGGFIEAHGVRYQ